ncbi:MAG: hypothetical protein K2K09_03275, partial [Lachnospiraceae bacterium]|nr:hypothetical protein [Lachnospiraceae bacterium]
DIGIDIVSDGAKEVSSGSIYYSESEGTCKYGMTCSTKGTYTVRIYYKNSDDTTYDTSTVKGSYTLLVDDEKILIDGIGISDVVKVYNREDIVPKYITLDGQFVKVMRAATPQTTITFEGKAFTTYNGKKIEVSIRDVFGLLAIDPNGLVWSAGGTENVSAEMSLSGECKAGIKSTSSSEEGILSVTLKYIPNNIEAGKDVSVSCAQAAPKGEHKVVEYENNKPGDRDLRGTDYKMQKGSVKRFGLIDIDQYKEVYEDTSLYTVFSLDSSAVVINVDRESNVNSNTFTVGFGEGAEFNKAYEIRVYIDKDNYYSFTVTMVETLAESVTLGDSELELILGVKDKDTAQ